MNTAGNSSGGRAAALTTVYVVDDEPMLLELTATILERLCYQVKTFRDPLGALASLSTSPTPPDLLITDYAMHAMDGLALIAACREIWPQQKALMVSGTVDQAVYRNSPAKPDRFLAKPYQAGQLVEAVAALLSG
jgi:CheY-like chemotaxis protein